MGGASAPPYIPFMREDMMTCWEALPSDLRNDIIKEIQTGHKMEMMRAKKNQQRIAKENQRDRRAIDGVGRHVASIDLGGYLGNKIFKGESLQDKEYLDWVIKRHPEVRVKSGGTKMQVGYGN